jgi:hypothetical protein
MNYWNILNEPFVYTVIGVLIGSIAASKISEAWQKRSQHHLIKLQYAQEIINIYQEYVRLLRNETVTNGELSKIHPKFLSTAKIIGFIFKDKRVGKIWITIVGKFGNIYGMKKQGVEKSLIIEKSEEIYDDASVVIEIMFKELA